MKAIFENEKVIFYENDITKSLTKDCTRDFRDLKPIACCVFICKDKENHNKRYVLFNEKGEPIESDCTLDGIGIKIETLRYLKTNGEITL